jgi:hypothetical protein
VLLADFVVGDQLTSPSGRVFKDGTVAAEGMQHGFHGVRGGVDAATESSSIKIAICALN